MAGEYITENGALLEGLIDQFYEASLANRSAINRAKGQANNSKAALKNLFMFYKDSMNTNPNISRNANARIEAKRKQAIVTSLNIDKATANYIGNYMKQFLEADCIREGERLGKMRKKNLPKEVEQTVAKIMRNMTLRKELVDKTKQTVGTKESEEFSAEEREQLLKEGYIECENPFYNNTLSEGDYQSGTRKTVKATILTILVFILSMVITNMVRVYFGGTPGGDFTSDAMKNGFMWFTTLILAPILEEPAKLIAVKGGYSKHFFFTFNFLEFGLYILMFIAGGAANMGVAILIRGVAVLMHALTTRILGTSKGKGFANTTFKLAVSILIHFIFNALFMKFMAFGVSGNALLLFAIGFFGVAFGLFLVSKMRNRTTSMSNSFSTTGNLEPQWSGYNYA